VTHANVFRVALLVLGALTAVVEALSNLPELNRDAVIGAIASAVMGYAVRYHTDVAKVQTSAPDGAVAQMAPTPDDEIS